MTADAPIRRTAEIEEITNLHVIHPIASRLVPLFARWHIPPNAVSLTGLLFGVLAGFAYYHYRHPLWDVAGFALMTAWHVMDGADGQLARFTHSQSHFGKVLDGISDASTFAAVYTAFALALGRDHGPWVYALIIAAAVCHATQAACYEAQRQEYDVQAWGRLKPQPRSAATGALPLGSRFLAFLDRFYCTGLSFPAADAMWRIRAATAAALEKRPDREPFVRERYRETFAPLLRQWSALSANYHTAGIFVCALLGAPQAYFWLTSIGFTAIMIGLLRRQNDLYAQFLRVLDTADTALP